MLTTPTTQDLSTTILNQLEASLGQSIPLLPKAFLRVLAKVLAGVWILLYRYVGFGHLQQYVAHASTQETTVLGRKIIPLVEWGRLFGVGDPLAATRAILDVAVPVTLQTGTLQSGTQLVHSASGVVYVTTAPVALNAASVTVRVRASSDQTGGEGLGTLGNRLVGDTLTFASPLPHVSRDCLVSAVVVTADDPEDFEDYRRRILERAQARPQGGAYADYRIWAREVPGIVAAYPYTGSPGEVDVYCEASVESSGSPDGIPTAPQLAAVLASINLDQEGKATRRPANAAVNVLAITRLPFSVEIAGLTGPSTLEADITAAITDYYWEREPFIVGLSVLGRKDRVLESSVIGIVDQIVNAAGGTVGTVTQFQAGPEIPVHTLGRGEKAKLSGITFL